MTSIGVFIWQFLLAWLLVVLAMYLPGRLLVRGLRLTLMPLEHMVVSLVGGAGLLVLVYWSLSLAHVQWLLWVYVAPAAGLESWYLYQRYRREGALLRAEVEVPLTERLREFWPLFLLMALGVLAQSRYNFWTVWPNAKGLDLLAWQASDAPWHVFNIYHLARTYPIELAGFSGQTLMNYHMLSHLLWGAILNLAPVLDAWHLYLRVSSIFYSALLTLCAFVAARAWSGKIRVAYLAAGLVLFAGNFTYVMPLLFGAQKFFLWDSIFWVQSPMGNIFNPGVSSSFLFLFMGLWALIRWVKERRWGYMVLVALLWGVLPGFKVYPGLLMLIALFMVAMIQGVAKRDWGLGLVWLAVLPVFLFIFLPPNTHSAGMVKLLPGFNLGTMLVAPDRMALMTSYQLKLLYAHHKGLVVLIMAGLFGVFVLGNLGMRVMGLPAMLRSVRDFQKSDPILLFITFVTMGAFTAPVLLVQSGVQWNTIQFAYFGIVLAALPAAQQFWDWVDSWARWKQYTLVALVILLGLPSSLQSLWIVDFKAHIDRPIYDALMWLKNTGTLKENVVHPLPDAYNSDEGFQKLMRNQVRGNMTSIQAWDQEAKNFAAQAGTTLGTSLTAVAQSQGSSLTASAESATSTALSTTSTAVSLLALGTIATAEGSTGTAKAPPSTWDREDSFFVASTTFKNTYLESTVTSQVIGCDVETRAREIRYFYEKADALEARAFLEQGRITYVMLYPGMTFPFPPSGVPLTLVFQNSAVSIYKYIPRKPWE